MTQNQDYRVIFTETRLSGVGDHHGRLLHFLFAVAMMPSCYRGQSASSKISRSNDHIATSCCEDINAQQVSGVVTNERHSKVTPEELSRKWNIGLQAAKDTLAATTQRGIRTAVHPMTRRVRVDHLDLHRPQLCGMWFVDTMLSKVN